MTTELAAALSERLYGDRPFATAFERDPFTTLRNEGFSDLATAAERDRVRIGELVDRIYADDDFREKVEQDPLAELIGWGLPEVAVGPLLLIAGAPADVIERATADVEAHMSARKPATVAAVAALLGTFAFAQQASASVQPAQSQAQISQVAKAGAQISQPARATVQISRTALAKAQISQPAQAKAQVANAAAKWHGIQSQQAKALGGLTSLLRANKP